MTGVHIANIRFPDDLWEEMVKKGVANKTHFVVQAVRDKLKNEGESSSRS
jgi:hypothetical protein